VVCRDWLAAARELLLRSGVVAELFEGALFDDDCCTKL
jgi:hypothetical protein